MSCFWQIETDMVSNTHNYFKHSKSSYLALYFQIFLPGFLSEIRAQRKKLHLVLFGCQLLVKEHSKRVLDTLLHFMALQNIKRLFCEKSKVIVSQKKTGEKLILKSKLQLSTIYYRVHSTEYIHTIFISCIWDSCQFPALSLCANTGITMRNVYIKSWIF